MLPDPITPSAPALLTALHKRQPLAQTIPAWMMGISMFNNAVRRLCNLLFKLMIAILLNYPGAEYDSEEISV